MLSVETWDLGQVCQGLRIGLERMWPELQEKPGPFAGQCESGWFQSSFALFEEKKKTHKLFFLCHFPVLGSVSKGLTHPMFYKHWVLNSFWGWGHDISLSNNAIMRLFWHTVKKNRWEPSSKCLFDTKPWPWTCNSQNHFKNNAHQSQVCFYWLQSVLDRTLLLYYYDHIVGRASHFIGS